LALITRMYINVREKCASFLDHPLWNITTQVNIRIVLAAYSLKIGTFYNYKAYDYAEPGTVFAEIAET